MTLREAESALEQAFIDQRYLRNPDVQIIVQQYEGKFVNVLGQVRAPGRVRMPDESEYMLLVDLISQVGGFTGIAKTDSVRITRKGEDGMEETLVIDVGAIITAREAGKEVERIRVYPGDIVFIPERIF